MAGKFFLGPVAEGNVSRERFAGNPGPGSVGSTRVKTIRHGVKALCPALFGTIERVSYELDSVEHEVVARLPQQPRGGFDPFAVAGIDPLTKNLDPGVAVVLRQRPIQGR